MDFSKVVCEDGRDQAPGSVRQQTLVLLGSASRDLASQSRSVDLVFVSGVEPLGWLVEVGYPELLSAQFLRFLCSLPVSASEQDSLATICYVFPEYVHPSKC
jgi:hypothetical protein